MDAVTAELPRRADVVVVGAGLVGAAVALYLARSGVGVCVLDRTGPAAGTSSAGEGNILVSDKLPGPELDLALHSVALWHDLAGGPGTAGDSGELAADVEFEAKGGLVVAADQPQYDTLRSVAADQAAAGVRTEPLDAGQLPRAEPKLAAGLAGAVGYPQDCQVQPMLAAAAMLRAAGRYGARLVAGAEVLDGTPRAAGGLDLTTAAGRISAGAVVNAAGPWSAEVAGRLGSWLPVRPRRGHILVTEPLPPLIRHKVYQADYLGTVTSDAESIAYSAVVEATVSGTVLIGSSREFVGPDQLAGRRWPEVTALAGLAQRATRLFPFLAGVRAIRGYAGLRPASPDHLPLIGPDSAVPGLHHATGHEGAGVGLAPATGELLAALLTGTSPAVDPAPFSPARFDAGGAGTDRPRRKERA